MVLYIYNSNNTIFILSKFASLYERFFYDFGKDATVYFVIFLTGIDFHPLKGFKLVRIPEVF